MLNEQSRTENYRPCPPAQKAGEEYLLQRAKAGDGAALERLFACYRPFVERVCRRLAGLNEDEQEDIAQKTLVRAFEQVQSFGGRSRFGTWLYQIAVRTYLNERAANKRHLPFDENTVDATRQAPDFAPEALCRVQAQQLLETLRAKLDPEDFRIVVLKYQMQMDSKEIAELLGRKDAAVRQRMRRKVQPALEALGREMER